MAGLGYFGRNLLNLASGAEHLQRLGLLKGREVEAAGRVRRPDCQVMRPGSSAPGRWVARLGLRGARQHQRVPGLPSGPMMCELLAGDCEGDEVAARFVLEVLPSEQAASMAQASAATADTGLIP